MRYIGTIFGGLLLLACLPFFLQESENFEEPEPECTYTQVTLRDGYFECTQGDSTFIEWRSGYF